MRVRVAWWPPSTHTHTDTHTYLVGLVAPAAETVALFFASVVLEAEGTGEGDRLRLLLLLLLPASWIDLLLCEDEEMLAEAEEEEEDALYRSRPRSRLFRRCSEADDDEEDAGVGDVTPFRALPLSSSRDAECRP